MTTNIHKDQIQVIEQAIQLLQDELKEAIGIDKDKALDLSSKITDSKKMLESLIADQTLFETVLAIIPSDSQTASVSSKKKTQVKLSTSRQRPTLPEDTNDIQMQLFKRFVSNDPSQQSNTLEQWDSIPKYFVTPAKEKELRNAGGLAGAITWQYDYRKLGAQQNKVNKCSVRIQPATIEIEGKSISFFPGRTEELIEEVLKKFVLEQNLGIHNHRQKETWVRFSINMIASELAKMGKQRSHDEIKHALLIMNRTHLTCTFDGTESYSGNLIPQLFLMDRNIYEEEGGTEKFCLAQLPVLITLGIDQYAYRQHGYDTWFSLDQSLSSYLYKRLVLRWTNASPSDPYTIGFQEIRQASALLQQESDRGNRKKLMSAINELISRGIIDRFDDPKELKSGRKIIDVHINVYPTDTFVKQQKAASKRISDSRLHRLNNGIT